MNRLNIKQILFFVLTLFLLFAICIGALSYKPSPPHSLGSVRINIETYLAGQNQPTHPSIVSFSQPWNGYMFWMAYSPYPYASGEEENPCVAASNNMWYWETPQMLANPIAFNEETGCDELKDPHLIYREDLDRLELWYLGRLSSHLEGDNHSLLLMRKYSYDGHSWSNYEIMSATKYLSPSILWNGEKYQMWGIGYDLWGTDGTLVYQESSDGIQWSDSTTCYIEDQNSKLDIWHGSVSQYEDNYYLVFIDNSDMQKIYCCTSQDGLQFDNTQTIINNAGYWDHLYRPYLTYDGETYFCVYGVINEANQWYLSMSTGTQIDQLAGISESDIPKMYPLSDIVIDTHSFSYLFRNLYHSVQSHLRLELLSLVFVEVIVFILFPKLNFSKYGYVFCIVSNAFLSCFWTYLSFRPSTLLTILASAIAIVLLNFGMTAVLYSIKSIHIKNKES